MFLLSVFILVIVFAWALWAQTALRSRGDQRYLDTEISEKAKESSWVHALTDFKKVTPPRIVRDFLIDYASRVYVNRVFWLRVTFGKSGEKLGKEKRRFAETRKGTVSFLAHKEEPEITVELVFDEGSFNTSATSQKKKLSSNDRTVFAFALKPLRAEELLLTVRIKYSAEVSVPEKVTSISVEERTDTEVKKIITTKTPETTTMEEMVLQSVPLVIKVRSFDGLNASQLGFLNKFAGAALTLVLIGLWYTFMPDTFQMSQAIELAVLGAAFSLGVPVYDGLVGLLTPKAPSEE